MAHFFGVAPLSHLAPDSANDMRHSFGMPTEYYVTRHEQLRMALKDGSQNCGPKSRPIIIWQLQRRFSSFLRSDSLGGDELVNGIAERTVKVLGTVMVHIIRLLSKVVRLWIGSPN